ncbi:MAG: hypothetical protein FJ005_00055 [Chloroflexi bacterium]|nr:hypothetical protein [Chloroflexota bacterium]
MSVVRGFFSGIFASLLVTALFLLGITITINLTILNPDFVVSELDKLDVYSVVVEQAKVQLPAQEFIKPEVVDSMLAELKPWLREQASTVIRAVYAYLKGEQELNVTVLLEPVRSVVKQNVRQAILESLPPELQGAPQSQIDAYMSQVYVEIDKAIPASFELNEAVVGSQMIAQLEQVKQAIGYVDTTYKALIALAVLLVLLIALVHWWQPKPITRAIGIVFIIAGVTCILGSLLDLLISQALSRLAGESSMLFGLQAKLPQLAADLTPPMRMYGIGFLSAGIVLIIISVLFRSPETSPD